MRRLLIPLVAAVAVVVAGGQGAAPGPAGGARTEVVVRLAAPSLAYASGDRARATARIEDEQRTFLRALQRELPEATPRWRYRIVANGVAVVLPERVVPRLAGLPGVRDVQRGATYTVALDRSPARIGAPQLWGPELAGAAGQGLKIGIIDDGIDQTHPFFDPAGYTMPAGFPKGQVAFTTAKVIVARAFPPPGSTAKNAAKPFDSGLSGHGTHVAGIAAGNFDTATGQGRRISGVAPRAYLGNYKALTTPTASGLGLNGNAPELVAAIEAAVADGMDVINLSIGEPEIDPARDIVALALDAAAAAGVVPVVAAGNDFLDFGRGSVSSPGTSQRAITVAAVTPSTPSAVAGFSASGPTPLSLRAKPDVAAPGVGILSSVPGGFASISGTSMAAPHVAGAAALLRQRHPGWTVEQLKGALVGTARPVPGVGGVTPPTRVGAGLVDLAAADGPQLVARPSSIAVGLIGSVTATASTVTLDDLGGGGGTWSAAVVPSVTPTGTSVSVAPQVAVPGPLTLSVSTGATQGDATGVIQLSRNGVARRIPYWLRVAETALAAAPTTLLPGAGTYTGDTRGREALVDRYRYPEVPAGGAVTADLLGPEHVFRVTLQQPARNFGVVVTARPGGSKVEPRIVVAGDENRLLGHPALPVVLNPYLARFGEPVLAAGALRPGAGAYDVVFDSPTANGAGAFTFRFWVNDVTPPTARLEQRVVRRGTPLRVRVGDAGSGVDAASVTVTIDGAVRPRAVRGGVVRIATGGLAPGRHALRVQVSDFQETRNTENVARILPNTRVLRTTITIR